ncbi:MAG TPA: hypothetical protein VFX59_06025 [Polyangiales bacterium]|nr:hypothetical protein [Polyangiales bacterium]
MKRSLLFVLALVACGDDDGPGDPPIPGERDARVGKSSDAAPAALLDAAIEAGPAEVRDARVADAAAIDGGIDAGNDAGNDAGSCVADGEDCQLGACCDGTACVVSAEAPYPACLATCAQDSECESGCCTALSGSARVCAAAPYCEQEADPTAPLTGINCYFDLQVFDSSGEYMGEASSSFFEADSVCNNTGMYGQYGSHQNNLWSIVSDAYSTTLAFSAVLGCGDDFPVLAYVSKYKGKADKRVIDPDHLCDVLENSNF